MKEALVLATETVVVVLDWIALICIVVATIDCLIKVVRGILEGGAGRGLSTVWLGFARGLVAALTFQLAADILETAIAPTWDDIGRLGAIAVIRTFLDYFLGRDVAEIRERRGETHVG